jgi:hypothetical protein
LADEENFCMLGLWNFVDGRMRLDIGVGWNMKSTIPPLQGYQAGGRGVAGPSAYCYRVGSWLSYGRRLTNPVLARYQRYDKDSRQWIGRHSVNEA